LKIIDNKNPTKNKLNFYNYSDANSEELTTLPATKHIKF